MFADRLTQWTDRLTVTIKPTWICNLRCGYCYQGRSRPVRGKAVMSHDVLEASIREASKLPIRTVDFQWIGGETLAPGLPFFEEALRLTRQYARDGGPRIVHWLQTNLTLIDEKWIEFLKRNDDDLVLSVSYDFFEEYFLQTQRNSDKAARHQWTKIQRALELLKANGVEFGCLTTIDKNALRIPAAEWFTRWLEQDIRRIGLQFDYGDVYSFADSRSAGHPWKEYIEFLDRLFALQAEHNQRNPEKRVLLRESLYLYNKLTGVQDDAWVGSCHHSPALCGQFFWTIDVDGEIYGMCDAFMTEEVAGKFRLGNVMTDDVARLKDTALFAELTDRQHALKHSAVCKLCQAYQHCRGGCPAFKSENNLLDKFVGDSVYCEYTRAFFDRLFSPQKNELLRNCYGDNGAASDQSSFDRSGYV